jgi:hypothetical protein
MEGLAFDPFAFGEDGLSAAAVDVGGREIALLRACRMHDVNPLAWLTQTLGRIAGHWPISQIDQLIPWHVKP